MAQATSDEKVTEDITLSKFDVPPCWEDKNNGSQTHLYLQWYLCCCGYDMMVDGSFGKQSIIGLQKFLNSLGNKLSVDGKLGKNTITAFQKFLESKLEEYAKAGGKFRYVTKVNVDGNFGQNTTRGLQRVLNFEFKRLNDENKVLFPLIEEDGVNGSETKIAIQLFLLSNGYNVNEFHPNIVAGNIRLWQMYLNNNLSNYGMSAVVDGNWGNHCTESVCSLLGVKSSTSMNKETVLALQKFLNQHFQKRIEGTSSGASGSGSEEVAGGVDERLKAKKEKWKALDFYCLDNSLRETTVGQVAAHTLENKKAIYEQVKLCGFTDIIVASFNAMTRVDDDFVIWLKETEDSETFDRFVSFSEITLGVTYDENGNSLKKYNTGEDRDDLPDGMRKNRSYELKHTFFEADFADDASVEWDKTWTIDDQCKLLEKRIRWVKDNISKDSRNLLNMRDFPTVMSKHPERMLSIVKFLAKMPQEYRLFGMAYEDPMGEYLPEQLGKWTKMIRDTMDKNGWEDGILLNHIHGKWGYKDASTMECLANGSNGMWAAICEEGAAVGHCSTIVAMMNLIRHGNTKISTKVNGEIIEKYKGWTKNARNAAIKVTQLTTTSDPHPKQIIYGERATDLVFGFLGIGDFDVADFFGYEAPNRITPLATTDMIVSKLKEYFGNDEQFNDTIAEEMRLQMQDDLRVGIKNEYDSQYGLLMLFERSGGKLTEAMSKELKNIESKSASHKDIKDKVKKLWDSYAKQDDGKLKLNKKRRKKRNKKNKKHKKKDKTESKEDGDDNKNENDCTTLSFDRFYHGFMQPFFGCYRCQVTKTALKSIDFDEDDVVDWDEFAIYIDWALRQYDIGNASECIEYAFEKGIIPAMRDDMATNISGYEINPENFNDHTATVIFFHGIADDDEIPSNSDYWFGKFNTADVQHSLKHIRFVFPDAKKLSISKADGKEYQAWFDINPNKDVDDSKSDSKSSSGEINDIMKSIKKMIRKEIRKYRIKSNRILLCGFNQGSMVALKAGLEMGKEFAGVVCFGGLLEDGKNSSFDQLFNIKSKKLKEKLSMPISWFDDKYTKLYNHLGDDYSKKCFDYLKDTCKFENAFYDKSDDFNKVLDCIYKQLPQKSNDE